MTQDDTYILISGLQHIVFCPRQWALIHMEQEWQENALTAEGKILHEKAHSHESENRPGLHIARGLPLRSDRLKLSGVADVVEFHECADGVALPGQSRLWLPFPVEYKHGRPKSQDCDRVQLCAQALCLEEMLSCNVAEGALFYGTTRRRESVVFTPQLRQTLEECCNEAQRLLASKQVPAPILNKYCRSCSLKEICGPETTRSVQDYLIRSIKEALDETPS